MNRRILAAVLLVSTVALSAWAAETPYLVVTSKTYFPAFKKFSAWKLAQGYKVDFLFVEDIQNQAGRDMAEKIRNAVAAKTLQNGYPYVLIGGDVSIVPYRMFKSPTSDADEPIPSDLYYAALDGNFDANGDGVFGDLAVDNIDVYPEVALGRFPFQNLTQAQAMIDKTVDFEMGRQKAGYDRVLMTFAVMDEATHAGAVGERLLTVIPPGLGKMKLYEESSLWPSGLKDQVLSYANATAQWNAGFQATFHFAHSNFVEFGGTLRTADVPKLANPLRASYLNSSGCNPGRLDENSVAKVVLQQTGTGMVGVTGNSGYGWYVPGDEVPIWYSPAYQFEMARSIFEEKKTIGEAHRASLIKYASDAAEKLVFGDYYANAMTYIHYGLVTYGDPGLRLFSGVPIPLAIAAKKISDPAKGSTLDVAVKTAAGSVVSGARVVLESDSAGLLAAGMTDAQGKASFGLPSMPNIVLHLIASKPDHVAAETFLVPPEEQVDTKTDGDTDKGGDTGLPGSVFDLIVDGPIQSITTADGVQTPITFTVRNMGDNAVQGVEWEFYDREYEEGPKAGTPNVKMLSGVIPSIDGGGSKNVTCSVAYDAKTYPNPYGGIPTFITVFKVDPNNKIKEAADGNNFYGVTVYIK